MTARELFQAGKLNETVQALSAELRDNPTDAKRRTFLFEVLCFAGEYDRAEKQLDMLGKDNDRAQMGALLYRGAINAERTRQDLFTKKDFPTGAAPAELPGMISYVDPETREVVQKQFTTIEDADARIGARLELFLAGEYLWVPFQHIETLEMQSPSKLRDLLWITALFKPNRSFKGTERGEVLVPALNVFSGRHADDNVRLGRETQIDEPEPDVKVPVGRKMWLVDDEPVYLIDIRKVEFNQSVEAE